MKIFEHPEWTDPDQWIVELDEEKKIKELHIHPDIKEKEVCPKEKKVRA